MTVFASSVVEQLQQEPAVDELLKREGGGGLFLTYLADYTVINKLNQVFNFNWNFSVEEINHIELFNGALFFSAQGTLSVAGEDGQWVSKSDVGTGITRSRYNSSDPYMPDSVDMAIKGAVSDCIKRCARQLGEAFGNSLYDKDNPLHDESDTYLREQGTHPGQGKSGGGNRRSNNSRSAAPPAEAPEPNGPNGDYICNECGDPLFDGGNKTQAQRAADSVKYQGDILCYNCGKKKGS